MNENETGGAGAPQPSATPDPNAKAKEDIRGLVAQLEAFLDEYMVEKAPFTIPMGGKEFIVKVSPYLVIILAIMAIPVIMLGLGLTAVLTPFAVLGGVPHLGIFAFIAAITSLITLVIELAAVPGLFARTKKGWRLVFYATLVSLVGSILSANVLGGILGAVIGWYILFQVKELYRN